MLIPLQMIAAVLVGVMALANTAGQASAQSADHALCTRDGSSACCCPGEFGRASSHLDVPTNALSQ